MGEWFRGLTDRHPLAARLLYQRDSLDRMSAIYVVLILVLALQFTLMTLRSTLGWERELAASLLLVAMVSYWALGHRRRTFPLAGVPFEAAAFVALAVIMPEHRAVSLLVITAMFRVLQVSMRQMIVLTVCFGAALPLMAGLQGTARFTVSDAFALYPVLLIAVTISRTFQHLLLSRDELNRRLRHQASHDQLTSLRNRAALTEELNATIDRLRNRPHYAGVLFIDLDDFKVVNDTFGHAGGDRILIQVATRLERAVAGSDAFVARLGGDEFAVVLPTLQNERAALEVAAHVLKALEDPFENHGREIIMRASIGVAMCDRHWKHAAGELLRRADVAMYAAKAKGKARVEMYRPSMMTDSDRQMRLAADLRRALQRVELYLEYQPVVRLDDRAVIGAEALVRWAHPKDGVISPAIFLPIADQVGMSSPIARMVISEAVRTLGGWRHRYPGIYPDFTIAVNLSATQLLDEETVTFIASRLEEQSLAAHSLIIEITETILMKDLAEIRERIQELKDMGVRVALDDFGTGYTSLAHLRDFPIDILKIDRSLLADLEDDARHTAVMRSVVDLSNQLQIQSLTEGIETEGEQRLLREYGCELGQGYLFGHPASAQHFASRYLVSPEALNSAAS